MTGRIFDLVLIFLATILGVLTYYADRPYGVIAALIALALILFALRLVVDKLLSGKDPGALRLWSATLCIFTWYGFLFAAIALVTCAVLALSFTVMAALQAEGGAFQVPKAQVNTVGSVVIGAVTTLIGAAFYGDVKDRDSTLWPPAMFKAYLAKVYGGHPEIKGRTTPELFDALYMDKTQAGIAGWGFPAALRRLAVIVPRFASIGARR